MMFEPDLQGVGGVLQSFPVISLVVLLAGKWLCGGMHVNNGPRPPLHPPLGLWE